MNASYGALLSSPLGPITLLATDTNLISLQFGDLGLRDGTPLLLEAQAQLTAYFSGKLRQFHLPLLTKGTVFQERVWAALLDIPYGNTISYRELAERTGSPRAFRAVGNANGKNPASHPHPLSSGHCKRRRPGWLLLWPSSKRSSSLAGRCGM